MQNFDHNIVFWEKRQFFRRKLSKIAENCDHNIDPWEQCYLQIGVNDRESLRKISSKMGVPGVDVMITILCDFSQFPAKKLAFFLNPNVMINFFQILALFWVKNADFFAKIFGENI
jgi:hypothetical protein